MPEHREQTFASWRYRLARRFGLTYSNGTIYNDIPIPFTNVRLIVDIGKNRSLGWGRRHG